MWECNCNWLKLRNNLWLGFRSFHCVTNVYLLKITLIRILILKYFSRWIRWRCSFFLINSCYLIIHELFQNCMNHRNTLAVINKFKLIEQGHEITTWLFLFNILNFLKDRRSPRWVIHDFAGLGVFNVYMWPILTKPTIGHLRRRSSSLDWNPNVTTILNAKGASAKVIPMSPNIVVYWPKTESIILKLEWVVEQESSYIFITLFIWIEFVHYSCPVSKIRTFP